MSTWAAVVSYACHNSTAPPAYAGDYYLTAVNGAALPASEGGSIQVLSGSLRLGADEQWILTRTQHALANPANNDGVLSISTPLLSDLFV